MIMKGIRDAVCTAMGLLLLLLLLLLMNVLTYRLRVFTQFCTKLQAAI
jgi:hypothetical protein